MLGLQNALSSKITLAVAVCSVQMLQAACRSQHRVAVDLGLRVDSRHQRSGQQQQLQREVVCMSAVGPEACRNCSEQQCPCLQMSQQQCLEVWRGAACFDYGLPSCGQKRHHRSRCHHHPTSQGRTAGQRQRVVDGLWSLLFHTMIS